MLLKEFTSTDFDITKTIVDCLVETELCKSRSEARRLISQGGIRINRIKVLEDRLLRDGDRLDAGSAIIQRGKNQFAIIYHKEL